MKQIGSSLEKNIDADLGMDLYVYKPSLLAPMLPDGALRRAPKRPWDGKQVAQVTKMIVGLQAELDRRLRGKDSPFYAKYLSVRDGVMEWLGKQPVNADQILQLQMAGAKDLTEAMTSLRHYAQHGIDVVTNYRDCLLSDAPVHVGNMGVEKGGFDNLRSMYDQLIKETNTMTIMDSRYVPNKHRLHFMERKMRKHNNAYRLSQRSLDHYLRTKQFFDSLVGLMEQSSYLSEQIVHEADMFIRDVAYARHVPGIINSQGKVAQGINLAMDNLGDHTEKLYSRMQGEISNLVSAGYRMHTYSDHYRQADSHVGRFLSELGSAEKEFNSGIDSRTDNYILRGG